MGTGPHRLASSILVATSLAACGAAPSNDGGPPSHPVLVVVNKCDGAMENGAYVFPLQQLKLHHTIDDYPAATNLLASPLNPGEEATFAEPAIQRGSWFVTVIRPTGPWQPQPVAVTGTVPIQLDAGLYRLLVYEEAFYLYPPTPRPDGLGRERGAVDRGAADGPRREATPGETRPPGEARPPDQGTVDRRPLDAGALDGKSPQ